MIEKTKTTEKATRKQYELMDSLISEINEPEKLSIPPSYTHETMSKKDASDYIDYLMRVKDGGYDEEGTTKAVKPAMRFSAVRHGLSVKLAQRELHFQHRSPMKYKAYFRKAVLYYYNALIATEAEVIANGGGKP